MNARFHVPDLCATGGEVDLPADEGRHLTRVLRLTTGDAVRVFDGRGRECQAVITAVGKTTARVRVGEPVAPAPEPRVAITLAQAVLKGDKMDDVVRDAVMLGAAAIQPIVTTRTEVSLATLQRANRRERWERVAVSSAKQCGRAVVPPIFAPLPFEALPDALRRLTLPEPAFMLVEPAMAGDAVALTESDTSAPREATLIIGPEGGWTPDEVDRAAPACRLVTLGGRTLRADAMAMVAMAALFAVWKEY